MNFTLKNSIAYRFIRGANSINKTINKKLKPFDIAIEQRVTLEIIKFKTNVNQTSIASLLGKDKTTVSRSLNSLEKKGLIKRTETLGDKRSNNIELTYEGEKILENTISEVESFRESLNQKLNKEEIEAFFKIIDKLEL